MSTVQIQGNKDRIKLQFNLSSRNCLLMSHSDALSFANDIIDCVKHVIREGEEDAKSREPSSGEEALRSALHGILNGVIDKRKGADLDGYLREMLEKIQVKESESEEKQSKEPDEKTAEILQGTEPK